MTTRILTGALVLLTLTGRPQTATVTGSERSDIRLVARMHLARSAATATATAGDRVLIAGGMAEGATAVRGYEVFDAVNNRVEAVGQMRQSRAGHSATLLPDGRVLIIGGYHGEY